MNEKNLIDTHAFLQFINGNKELSKNAGQAIEAEGAINFISIASLWEIAIKVSLGKLILNTDFNKISDEIIQNGFEILPLTFEDTLEVSILPFHHRDPFDRIIIAQAITNKLTLISKDEHFSKYLSKIIYQLVQYSSDTLNHFFLKQLYESILKKSSFILKFPKQY